MRIAAFRVDMGNPGLNEPDERIDFAIAPIDDLVKVKYYKVRFEILDSAEE